MKAQKNPVAHVLIALALIGVTPLFSQTAFVDFTSAGQYTSSFNQWNDAGGVDGGNYCFIQSANAGVGDSGGVSVFQSTDTTATYKLGSWNFSTNGATLIASVLLKANGQTGNRVQFGIINTNGNGLNGNPNVAFESYRLIPSSSTVWSLREQVRSNNVTVETTLGNVNVVSGRWYKFVVSLTNSIALLGNYDAGCGLYDFGNDGLTPGTNTVTFSTVRSHTGEALAQNPAVWAALRGFQNGGINAWDNFLVYTPKSPPVITLPLTNVSVAAGVSATFRSLADGPGNIAYSWYTNGTLVPGVASATYVTPLLNSGDTNVMVVAGNGNGSVSNQASIFIIPLTLAQITNLPATAIQGASATLNGQVTATGGDTPTVTLFYGLSNGGTNPVAWAQSVSLGLQNGAFSQNVSGLLVNKTYFYAARAVNGAGTAWATPSRSFTTLAAMSPLAVTGFNRDLVIENTAVGPPYDAYASQFNPGENTAFYQSGLSNKNYGLPVNGSFISVIGDGTEFQLQPYTTDNALLLSSDTGLTSGTLTLATPQTLSRIAVIAHSGSGGGSPNLTLQFNNGSTSTTTYNAADWFFNPGFALQGFDRINLTTGNTGGGPNDPRFYQTTIDLAALLGPSNRPLASLTFDKAAANATAIYAVSGFPTSAVVLASVSNAPASSIQAHAATLAGVVNSTGGESPAITIYYGTSNAGTNAAAWMQSVTLGSQSGAFSRTVTGLAQTTTYFFTAKAVNSAGTVWASPSQSLTTLTSALAVVSNKPASSVTASSATLGGEVVSTGGDPPDITIYYGTSDGGNNPLAWAQNISLGIQSGSFSQTVFGLNPNTIYYFTCKAVNLSGTAWATPPKAFTTLAANAAPVAVLSQHNDHACTGANLNESVLNLSNVNTNQFGLLFSRLVDDQIYAQPLLVTNVNIPGQGMHNVVYVCSVNDSVYAFDADNPALTSPYWQINFLGNFNGTNVIAPRNTDMTGACGGNYRDFSGNMGIVSTPVIDPIAGTIYLVARTKETTASSTNFVQRLHALDIRTGAERNNSPVILTATYAGGGGIITFDSQRQNQRSALTLVNGAVYIGWASHCDWGPYHGWLMGYDAITLQRVSVYNTTRNGSAAGIWMSGAPPAADPSGNLYISTGNGSVGVAGNRADLSNRGESLLKLTPSGTNLTITSWFTPYNWQTLENGDIDLGSGGVLLIPGTTLALSGGKEGKLYLVDRDNMGGLSGSPTADTNVVQSFQVTGLSNPNDIHGAPVWWDGPNGSFAYVWGEFDYLHQYQFDWAAGKFFLPNYAQSNVRAPQGMPGGILSISANGTNGGSGILWAAHQYTGDANQAVRPGVLRAYNAQDVGLELWNSEQVSARDSVGNFAKFCPPTVANGKVYLGTFSNRLNVYGLLPRPSLAIGASGNNVQISWPTNGFSNYKLQSTPSLLPANWQDSTNAAIVTNGVFQVTIPASNGVTFYRLRL